jgi:hypothetical protein
MYVMALRRSPVEYPAAENDFEVYVPGLPAVPTWKDELYHAKTPSQIAQTALEEILPHGSMLNLMINKAFVEDEFLHSCRHINQNYSVPIWASLALLIQLDIKWVSSIFPSDTLQDLKNACQVTKARMKAHDNWVNSCDYRVWTENEIITSTR